MISKTKDSLKQWLLYSQEFRIGIPKGLELAESLEELTDSLKTVSNIAQSPSNNENELVDMAADVGTLVWRIQKRLVAAGDLSKQLQRVSRDVESALDALNQRGIEIKDHTGQNYDAGMALRVITFQPVTGLTCQRTIETLKPTVYYRNRIVQMGEVVVGDPAEIETSKQE